MRQTRLTFIGALMACAALLLAPLGAQTVEGVKIMSSGFNTGNDYPDFARGIAAVNADASPVASNTTTADVFIPGISSSPVASLVTNSGSNIDNYLYQDEQVTVNVDDGSVRVLRTNQKNLVQEYVSKTVEVMNIDPIEIRNALRTVVGKEGGRAETIRDKVAKRYWIHIVAPKWQIPSVVAAIQALDEEWVSVFNDGSASTYYQGKFREIERIDRLAQDYGGTIGFSTIDANNNAVFRYDEPFRIEKYLKAAKIIDIPEHEILLEGAIYELNRMNDLKMGLDYIAWKNGPGRNLFDFLLAGEQNHEKFRGASSAYNPRGRFWDGARSGNGGLLHDHRKFELTSEQQFFGVNYLLTAAYLDFLQSKGKAKVLARPMIRTRSGTVGTWESLDPLMRLDQGPDPLPNGTLPVTLTGDLGMDSPMRILGEQPDGRVTIQEEGNAGFGDLSVSPRTLSYKKHGMIGLSLSILPFIGTETTELTINFAASDFNGIAPQGTPIINTRTYSTTVRIADGKPFVVAGVRRDEKVKMKAGVPWLSALPVAGWLFGGETKIDHQSDVAMVLKPSIYLGAASDMERPSAAVANIIDMAKGNVAAPLPDNPLGFDMYFMDADEK